MPENKSCVMGQLIAQLASEGWRMQRNGMVYINGTLNANLYKNGEIISLPQEFWPDDEAIADLWPNEPDEVDKHETAN